MELLLVTHFKQLLTPNQNTIHFLQGGIAYRFVFDVVSLSPVQFQVWRHVDGTTNSFELVGQYRFVPTVTHVNYEVISRLHLSRVNNILQFT